VQDQLTKETVSGKFAEDFDIDVEKTINKSIIPTEFPN